MTTFLLVNKPVASLQCDVKTSGKATLILSGTAKTMQQATLPDGLLRILIFGLDQSTFSGVFVSIDAVVESISNVIAANPDATNANANVVKLSSPDRLIIKQTIA